MDDAAVEVCGKAGKGYVGRGVGVIGAVTEVGLSKVKVEQKLFVPICLYPFDSDEALFVVAALVDIRPLRSTRLCICHARGVIEVVGEKCAL